jgi:uncharacterized protein
VEGRTNRMERARHTLGAAVVRSMGPGRAELDYGPVTLRVLARAGGRPHSAAALAAADAAARCLEQLAPFRAIASQPIGDLPRAGAWPSVVIAMIEAARVVDDATVTPMVAVAGSIAQIAAQAAVAAGAGTAMVENGGDIAIVVESGDVLRIGVARSLVDRRLSHVLVVGAEDGVGGVCTSGLGGRSFTRGIAEAAVAIAATASLADACATLLGNAAFSPDSAIEQRPAVEIDPATDIPHLLVTTGVGELSSLTVDRALRSAETRARSLIDRGLLLGAIVTVQGVTRVVSGGLGTLIECV